MGRCWEVLDHRPGKWRGLGRGGCTAGGTRTLSQFLVMNQRGRPASLSAVCLIPVGLQGHRLGVCWHVEAASVGVEPGRRQVKRVATEVEGADGKRGIKALAFTL